MSRLRHFDPEVSDHSVAADVLFQQEPEDEEDGQDEEDDDNEMTMATAKMTILGVSTARTMPLSRAWQLRGNYVARFGSDI